MPINGFEFPSVTFEQGYAAAAPATVKTLGTACIGPQYNLHKADNEQTAAYIESSADYDTENGLVVDTLPKRSRLGKLDSSESGQRLVVKDGIFRYYTEDMKSGGQVTLDGNVLTFGTYAVKDGDDHIAPAQFGIRGVQVGDPIIIEDAENRYFATVLKIGKTEGIGYNKVTVAKQAIEGIGELKAVSFCEKTDASYKPSQGTFSIDGNGKLTIKGGLTTELSNLVGLKAPLEKGEFYIEYRERVNDYVGKLGTIGSLSDVEEILGEPCEENPLALACYFAFAAGNNSIVYFTGVRTDDVDGYQEAVDYLANYSEVYSLVPCTEDADVICTIVQMCTSYASDEHSKIRRAVWYGVTQEDKPVLWQGLGTFNATTASDESGKVTALSVELAENAFIDHPIQEGDVIALVNNPNLQFTVTSTDDVNTAELKVDGVEVPSNLANTPQYVRYVRTSPNNADLADSIIAKRKARSQSERACCVWADGVLFKGEQVSNIAVAAAAAGMRSGEAVHRPLSNLGYSFFTLAQNHGFTDSQLTLIGSNGIWIVSDNDEGTPINKKQVTTAVANNLNLDEESIIANIDTVALSIMNIGKDIVGCSNINPVILATLSTLLEDQLDKFLADSSNNIFIGPQLLDYEITQVYQDTVNLDHVYADITVTPPKPFNRFHMTMQVI